MSGRQFAVLLALAVLSAVIGAGVAVLFTPDEDSSTQQETVAIVTAPASPSQADQSTRPAQIEQEDEPQIAEPSSAQPQSQPQSEQEQQSAAPTETAEAMEVNQSDEPDDVASLTAESEQQSAEAVEVVAELAVIELSPSSVTQGEAFSVLVTHERATEVAATVVGRSWSLAELAPGEWWGIVAIPRDAIVGSHQVVVDLYDKNGWLHAQNVQIGVVENIAPLEEIVLGGSGTNQAVDAAAIQRDHDVRFVEHVAVSGPPRWTGAWQLPIEGEVTGVFGAPRSYDGVRSEQWHHGHDIAAMHGDPIVAPAPGVVVWTGEVILHGLGLILDHGAGVYSGYWHMSLIAVSAGTEIAAGDWLGNIGSTGLSTGPHLHWEVIVQGIDVDPVQWLGDSHPSPPTIAEGTQNEPVTEAEDAGQAADTIES